MPRLRNKPTHDCMIEWFPEFQAECLRRGYIKRSIDIYQLIGDAPKSAGYHRKGCVIDFGPATPEIVGLARNMGCPGSRRDGSDGMSVHFHGGLKGCPELPQEVKNQITEIEAGGDGLVGNKRDDTSENPRRGVQIPFRTWRQGLAWVKQQQSGLPTKPEPTPKTVTILDIAYWNVAYDPWFDEPGVDKGWGVRGPKIGKILADMDCSIVCVGETKISSMTKTILEQLGSNFRHISSPIGNDIFFNTGKYDLTRPYKEYSLGSQNRYAGVLHLDREETGHGLSVVNTHFPYGSASARRVAANNLVELLVDVDDPIILTGDFNNQSFASGTPHKILRDAGYQWLREQVPGVINRDKPEFPQQGRWLGDMATKPTRKGTRAKFLSGELLLTSPELSDHRPFKGRVEIR